MYSVQQIHILQMDLVFVYLTTVNLERLLMQMSAQHVHLENIILEVVVNRVTPAGSIHLRDKRCAWNAHREVFQVLIGKVV